ncbi:hypothetical protein [Streptomyces coffeae]|uniref:Uncharacterized protein n=1 Tax=Streptomyces coffeae TaxID=621382 RepID=A0ABS1N7N6_9ACTN|nr:hypothetical protein [Streptomyces coffeae]MBL1096095.1 hypothetical protein [Streptomyces coffeae]
MAGERNPHERESPLWKWLSLGIIALLLGGALWLVLSVVLDDPLDNTAETSCSGAMSFAGGELPEGVTDEHCTERSWQDVTMEGSFRMPRADVAGWLDSSFPGSRERASSSSASCDGDLCLHIEPLPMDAEAAAADITVVYEGGDTALVHFSAFTV